MKTMRGAACWLACCLPVLLAARSFVVADSCTRVGPAEVRICLPESATGAVFVDFAHLVLAGDTSGIWKDLDDSGAVGQFPFLEFTHVAPGGYAFSYAVRPTTACPDSLFLVKIEVADCHCPTLSENKLPALCRPDAHVELGVFSKKEAGNWSIAVAPPGSTAVVAGGVFDATASAAGRYWLTYQFASVPLPTCAVADTIELTVAQPVFEKITATGPSCLGEKSGSIHLDSVAGGVEPMLFSIENEPFSSGSLFEKLPARSFHLKIEDAAGCQADTVVALAEPPALALLAGIDTAALVGDTIQFLPQASFAVDSFWWAGPGVSAGCWQPKVEVVASSSFKLTALDAHGCRAEAGFQVKARRSVPVYFPNVFRPGGGEDGVFKPFARGGLNLKIRRLAVRSRWGEVVFFTQNLPLGDAAAVWDGTFRGKTCPSGVYLWSAEIELADGSVEVRKGDVTLVER